MLKDFFRDTSTDEAQAFITASYVAAKDFFTENTPYKIYPSSISRTDSVVIFSNHFIEIFREVLSFDGASILKMSEEERDVWYSYNEYIDGTDPVDAEMLLVVQELDNCISNEITCKTEDYLNAAFDTEHTWESNPQTYDSTSLTVVLTQDAYDTKLDASEVMNSTTYLVQLDSITVKIYIGTIVIWTL